jgi:hypothetical protein
MGWRYEGLFEREVHPGEVDLSAWWRQEQTMIPVGRMGYRRRTVLAGDRLECEIYPVFGREDEGKARAARKNETPEKQKRLNRQRAERYITLLADTNFTEKDIELTLTYRNTYQPDYERCQKDVNNFIRKVKRYREKRGLEQLKYIYVIEGGFEKKNGFGTTKLHCHMMMNGGVSREILEEIWEYGYANTKQLQPDEDRGLEELAKYMIKESKGRGRRYCHSRNLKKPLIKTRDARTSNRVVKAMVKDIRYEARDEMEKRYPSYKFIDCKIYCSDQMDGVYIRVLMRRRR